MLAPIDYFAAAAVALIFCLLFYARIRELGEYLAERKRRRHFQKFEDVIAGVDNDPAVAQKYFTGEVKLPEDINVIIPFAWETGQRMRLQDSIDTMLREAEVGYVVRGFQIEEICGFDIVVNDFVVGVDMVRRQLVKGSAPRGTLIEYTGGDLLIYEDD